MRRTLVVSICHVVAVALFGACPLAVLGDEAQESLPRLTVSSNRFGAAFELVTLDIQGENVELTLPFRCDACDPSWSPDGRKLVYRSGKSGQLQDYAYDFDRGEEINLTKTATREHQPLWSPDGKQIVFTSERSGNHDIFLMNADGSSPVNLTNNAAFDSDPSWSPDGKQIAFGSNRGRSWRLYVMDADGSNVRDVLGHSLDGWTSPSWSPDGEQIVYTGPGVGGLQVFVVNADGNGEQVITDGAGANTFPVYSPDGRYIAYLHYDTRPENAAQGGTLTLYDLESLTHTPLAPEGMHCGVSKVAWKTK
jgi:tol-pal system beta propeller repeat protein TolB